MTNKTIAICLLAGVLSGCSSANVTKSPGPGDNGIRYWRPKPYLLVTPADATGRMVKLELQYLPDYNEEYSIHPRGRKPPAVALKDGWNLVAVGGPAPPPDKPEAAAPPPPAADGMKLPEYVLAAGNIPIGFYEAVFETSGQSKYMKGWRYIGWSVWGGGNPNGVDPAQTANQKPGCPPGPPPGTPTGSAIQGALYGIVFFNGAMTFRQIDEIAGNMTCPQYARTVPPPTPANVGVEGVPVPIKPPGSGAEAVPVPPATTTPKPPTANPGTGALLGPKPSQLRMDAGVTHTSNTTRAPEFKGVTPIRNNAPARKVVDPAALAALEAEVFKRLDLPPPAGAKGSTPGKSSDSVGTRSSKISTSSGATAPATTTITGDSLIPDLNPATPVR